LTCGTVSVIIKSFLFHNFISGRRNGVPEEFSGAVEPTTPFLTVVVPAYNEEARIGASLQKMWAYFDERGYEYDILVVDDGSTDGTRQIVESVIQGHSNIHILHYDGNRGKGYAVRYGMLRAMGNFILFSDADLATPIEEEQKLFDAIRKGADIAIGSRDVPGSQLERRQSLLREMGGKLFNRCVQWIAVPGIRDTQCGFKLFTRAAARNIFSRCEIDNFSFDVEVLYLGRLLGYKIVEVPVRWAHQEGSKVRFLRDGFRMLRTLCCIRATNYRIKQVDYERSSAP
jgi:dolichyl-phosphate beta-glucosyltransferase